MTPKFQWLKTRFLSQSLVGFLVHLPPSPLNTELPWSTHASMISRPREEKAGRPWTSTKKKSLSGSVTSVQVLLTERSHLPRLNSNRQKCTIFPIWQKRGEWEIFMRSNMPFSTYLYFRSIFQNTGHLLSSLERICSCLVK